jgi:hypothetical protein
MNIYLSVIRVLLIFGALGFLIIGTSFLMQNWQGSSELLGAGAFFLIVIVLDVFVTKKVFRANR